MNFRWVRFFHSLYLGFKQCLSFLIRGLRELKYNRDRNMKIVDTAGTQKKRMSMLLWILAQNRFSLPRIILLGHLSVQNDNRFVFKWKHPLSLISATTSANWCINYNEAKIVNSKFSFDANSQKNIAKYIT